MMDFHPFAAGAADWLDELPIGVFIAAIDQFGQRLGAIRPFVVDAGEIKRSKRIVRRANDEQAGKAAIELFQRVAQAGRFKRGEILARATPYFLAPGAELVRICFRR